MSIKPPLQSHRCSSWCVPEPAIVDPLRDHEMDQMIQKIDHIACRGRLLTIATGATKPILGDPEITDRIYPLALRATTIVSLLTRIDLLFPRATSHSALISLLASRTRPQTTVVPERVVEEDVVVIAEVEAVGDGSHLTLQNAL